MIRRAVLLERSSFETHFYPPVLSCFQASAHSEVYSQSNQEQRTRRNGLQYGETLITVIPLLKQLSIRMPIKAPPIPPVPPPNEMPPRIAAVIPAN